MLKDTKILQEPNTRSKIFELPDKLLIEWDSEAKAIIDTWSSYHITKEEFEKAVMGEGLDQAVEQGAVAWVADARNAKGSLTNELYEFMEKEVFPKLVNIGIKYFITINSTDPDTRLTVKKLSSKAESSGLKLMKSGSLESAIYWLKKKISLFS